MKAVSSKSANNEVATAKPFFKKGVQDAFFLNGNKTENSFFNAYPIQASMTVGQPDDPFELEAEKVSRQVVDGFDQANSIQRKFYSIGLQQFSIQPFTIGNQISKKLQKTISRTPIIIQAKCATCDEEEKMQQKSGDIQFAGDGTTVSPNIESQIQGMKGGGHGMDSDTKTAMESSFGADFSGVKVHTNSQAIQMSKDLNAHAFTVGNDIFFNEGRYQPQSKQGAGLLAHELTHTVQQGASLQNKRINTSSLFNSLSAHSAAHLSAISNGETPGLNKKEMAQLEKLPEEEMVKMQQMQMLQTKGVDEVQKKDNSLKLRRCVSSKKTPKLGYFTNNGPNLNDCGKSSWGIQWKLTEKSDATKGGWVIQKVDGNVNSGKNDAATNLTIDDIGFQSAKVPYWEAWRIPPGEKITDYAVGGDDKDDTYAVNKEVVGYDGDFIMGGEATYYDGLDKGDLPASFQPTHPHAGILPATTTAPVGLSGATNTVPHKWTLTWDCKAASVDKKTKIKSRTPDQ